MNLATITAPENSKRLIISFYVICLTVFLAMVIFRLSYSTTFMIPAAITATALVSALLLTLMALLLHWKYFWALFIAHSLIVLLLLVVSYWLYAYSIQSSKPYISLAISEYLTYLRFTSLCPAMSLIRFAVSRNSNV